MKIYTFNRCHGKWSSTYYILPTILRVHYWLSIGATQKICSTNDCGTTKLKVTSVRGSFSGSKVTSN